MSVVVILHLGLLKLPWLTHLKQEPAAFESVIVLLPDKKVLAEPLLNQNHAKDIKPPNPVNTRPIELNRSDSPPEVAPAAGINGENVPNPLDWRAARDAAIQSAVKTATAKPTTRLFGESAQQPQPASEPQPLFTEPTHRFGETTKTLDGDSIVWLSANCYQIANSDSSHFNAFTTGTPDTSKNYVRCKRSFGKAQSNPHLFDHLKRKPENE